MRNLLWKDFWQNSRVFLAVAIVAAAPYLGALGISAAERLFWPSESHSWITAVRDAGWASAGLSVLMAAFIGGNAIAGERADRSAEFAAGLPILRRRSITSKAAVSGLVCAAMWVFNAAVLGITVFLLHSTRPAFQFNFSDEVFAVSLCGSLGVLLFGIAWLFSSLLNSPAIAAAAAIGTVAVLYFAVLPLQEHLPDRPIGNTLLVCLMAIPLVVGLVSFVVGSLVCLRRAEA